MSDDIIEEYEEIEDEIEEEQIEYDDDDENNDSDEHLKHNHKNKTRSNTFHKEYVTRLFPFAFSVHILVRDLLY
jgi:hypothetical protein